MAYMRNVIREKECEMKEVAGKVGTTTIIITDVILFFGSWQFLKILRKEV